MGRTAAAGRARHASMCKLRHDPCCHVTCQIVMIHDNNFHLEGPFLESTNYMNCLTADYLGGGHRNQKNK